jgi:putative nucleotidyltransferase with HDIG domain
MTRYLNLSGRTFLLIAITLGLASAAAQSLGVLCTSPIITLAGVVILSIVLSRAVCRLQSAAWSHLMQAVRESLRTEKFQPDFPVDSSLPDANHLAEAMNGAARSILKSHADLEHAYLQFVETMAQALDARDPYTAGHSLRVAEFSHALAIEMGLPESDAEMIRIGAQLHDIGKIGIPDAVLRKPGLLTPEEYGLIKLHPQIGRKILEKVGRFEELLSIIELHHENHDGTGYPYGLSDTQIPLPVRIVHVADSFDAMTTSRSYRPALSLHAAVQEMKKNIGRQFDPLAVKAFLRLIAAGKIELGGLEPLSLANSASNPPAGNNEPAPFLC